MGCFCWGPKLTDITCCHALIDSLVILGRDDCGRKRTNPWTSSRWSSSYDAALFVIINWIRCTAVTTHYYAADASTGPSYQVRVRMAVEMQQTSGFTAWNCWNLSWKQVEIQTEKKKSPFSPPKTVWSNHKHRHRMVWNYGACCFAAEFPHSGLRNRKEWSVESAGCRLVLPQKDPGMFLFQSLLWQLTNVSCCMLVTASVWVVNMTEQLKYVWVCLWWLCMCMCDGMLMYFWALPV